MITAQQNRHNDGGGDARLDASVTLSAISLECSCFLH